MPNGSREGPIHFFVTKLSPPTSVGAFPLYREVATTNLQVILNPYWNALSEIKYDRVLRHTITNMRLSLDDVVTVWLGQLQAGEWAEARPLWEKYFHRLVGLARKRLRDAPLSAAKEEDVALIAF
jgi:hypothetical protein